ncbi:MAG: glycoside hydrolase family 31 protein [Lacibacter sp.]
MKEKFFIILLLFVHSVSAQVINKTGNGIKTTVNGIDIEIQFFNPQIVRILKSPEGSSFKKESISVIKIPGEIAFNVLQENGNTIVKTNKLAVAINTVTGKVSFSNLTDHLFAEKDYGIQFTPVKDVSKETYNVRQAFMLDKDEAIYGLGQQQNGKLNQRNQKVFLRQENMKVCIPFFQSLKGYGVFWDNYSATTFTDNPQETSFDSEVGDCADYYFLLGGNADGVIAQLRELTGQAPMMPLWSFGFNQSRERYKTQNELLEVVTKYRSLKVPLDGIIQDWQYWGKDSNWNAMSFDPVTFPDPQLMVDSVHKMKAHLFVVAWPGFGPKTELYKAFKEKKMLLNFQTWPPHDGVTPYDPYNPVARDMYWEKLNKGVFQFGVDAWWLDSSEPDHMNLQEKDFNLPTYLGTYRSVVNAFPIQHVGGIYDHQRKTTSAKRVTILTRSAFAGQQRYAANTWSGDVASNWTTFRKQIPAGLNFSLTGIPYWNTDIGGFFAGHFSNAGGAKNPEFAELYTRWMQFATFTPMMRSHGTDIKREIYQFGERGDSIFDVQEKFINLRYSLLPYAYSTAWNVTSKSGSIIRALVMDFAADKNVYNIDNEFLFGQSILVTPVTEKGTQLQKVYLPAGANWFDLWTGEILQGGKYISKATPINSMPVYIKAGSIIPWGPKVQYAEEKKWDKLEIRIYPGADATFTLYEDDNNSYDYEKGKYSVVQFSWNDKERKLVVGERAGEFPGMLKSREFKIVMVNTTNCTGVLPSSKFNKTIKYAGKEVTVKL